MTQPLFKVFGIGLSKTGTTSLNTALNIIGFKAIHFPNPANLLELMKSHDAATDTPVAAIYPLLDETFQRSRFILTDRDFESWMHSAKRHFIKRPTTTPAVREVRMKLYNTPVWDENMFATSFWRHKACVLSYFLHRPADLLCLNITAGDGWDKLCRFLDVEQPKCRFPWDNNHRKRK